MKGTTAKGAQLLSLFKVFTVFDAFHWWRDIILQSLESRTGQLWQLKHLFVFVLVCLWMAFVQCCLCCVWQFVFFSLSFIKFSPILMVLCIAISIALYNCQIQYLDFNPPVSQLLCLTTFGLSLPLGVIVFMCLQPIPKMPTAFDVDILLCLKVLPFFFFKCNSICVG